MTVALAARRVFDGFDWHEEAALLIRDGLVEGIVARSAVPRDAKVEDLGDALLAPGFVDLQVNGGGGVMLNDRPDVETIGTICRAHAPFGTTALLPTLITDTVEMTEAAIAAGVRAAKTRVPGFLGLHLEGPHLSVARKGAHDPALIRPMDGADQRRLIAAAKTLPVLKTTVAIESVTRQQIEALRAAGVFVSLGHSDASYAQARAAIDAGASLATHLFNAMSQIGSREAGLAGAAIASPEISAGLIADGIHVDPVTIGIALRAKRGPGRIYLVTDAMATIGTDMTEFTLNGRVIQRSGGTLRLADGTLAGADLDMISAVRFMHRRIGLDLSEALRMASLYPAQAVERDARMGSFRPGMLANIVALSPELAVRGVWIEGARVFCE